MVSNHEELIARVFEDCRLILKKIIFLITLILGRLTN